MTPENKLFKSGQVVLRSKSYGLGISLLISLMIATFLTQLIVELGLPDHWYFTVPVMLIFILLFTFIYQDYIQKKVFPNSAISMRYDSIVLLDDCLIGRWSTRGGTVEDKIQFKDIEYVVEEGNKLINITFKKDFEPSNSPLQLHNNLTQDYKFDAGLSKKQKLELVNYLNDRVKNQNIE